VISRNGADGAEVTHFKITGITGGALYLNDGTTPITNGSFITFAQASAGLKFTPAANSTASGSFQVQASTSAMDAGLGGGVATATITVIAVNDQPTSIGIADVAVNEDAAPSVSDLFAAFADFEDADAALTYTVIGNTNPGLFSATTINGAAGTLTLSYAANANGASNITVRATDTGTQFVETTFTVTINAVNDAPVLGANSLSIDQGALVTFGAGNLSASDIDSPLATLVYTVSGVTNGRFQLSGAPGVAISSFTQPQLDAGQVVFVHNGGVVAPAYSVQVSDGSLADGPAAARITFGAVVISEDSAQPEPQVEEAPPPVELIEPASPVPEAPAEAPPAPLPPVFSPGRTNAATDDLVETITQLKRAEARHLGKVVQPVLSTNDYEPAPPVDLVIQLLNVTPAQLEYRATTPLDWQVAPAFEDGFEDEAQQQLQVLLDSVKFGGMALSVGVVWWASRISAMLGSLLASAPAWRHIDPLPVVGGDEGEQDKWLEPDDREADANELAVALVLEGAQVGQAGIETSW
jgi:hypothetical protein